MVKDKNGDLLCDRCHEPVTTFTMSWFNTDEICKECSNKEKEHPKFKEAKAYIYEQESQGNMNATGIGLPRDLLADDIEEDEYEEDSHEDLTEEDCECNSSSYDKEAFSSFHDYFYYIEGQNLK